ncbi:MAG: BatD family protein [Candidatus Omnitrophica bacterium]|nr:BatD family protein [Candidatus Omnitrophota bacterium]
MRKRFTSLLLALTVGTSVGGPAWAQDLTFSATADKTTLNVGDPLVLTITLGGDISGIEIPVFEFPEGFTVASRSQSSNFSIRLGTVERSLTLAYVLIPQQGGTFQLGPFQITQKDQAFSTEPLAVTVEKPAVPPRLGPEGGRFTL